MINIPTTDNMKIKIAIVDDHPMMIEGIVNLLSQYKHLEVIDTSTTGGEMMQKLSVQQPDVLLLDIQLPDQGGDELVPLILKKYPAIKILVLTNFDSGLYANNMFKRGVHGYLLKTADKETLLTAIQTVYNNQEYIQPVMKDKIAQMEYKVRKTVFSKNSLTPREKEVLQCLANGETSQDIAEKLYLSINTVNNYRTSIMLKLDAKNMAILVKKALKMGLID